MTVAMRRELCAVMEYKVIERAGTVLYNDGDVIDSWSAILNGSVEVVHSHGHAEELHDRFALVFSDNYSLCIQFYHTYLDRIVDCRE